MILALHCHPSRRGGMPREDGSFEEMQAMSEAKRSTNTWVRTSGEHIISRAQLFMERRLCSISSPLGCNTRFCALPVSAELTAWCTQGLPPFGTQGGTPQAKLPNGNCLVRLCVIECLPSWQVWQSSSAATLRPSLEWSFSRGWLESKVWVLPRWCTKPSGELHWDSNLRVWHPQHVFSSCSTLLQWFSQLYGTSNA